MHTTVNLSLVNLFLASMDNGLDGIDYTVHISKLKSENFWVILKKHAGSDYKLWIQFALPNDTNAIITQMLGMYINNVM